MSSYRRFVYGLLLVTVQALAGTDGTPPTQEVFPFEGGRFVILRSQDGTCVIALQGIISRFTTLKFDDVVSRSASLGCAKPWLMLESGGGAVTDGIRLAKEVRSQGFRTITRYECASSCSMIFMGGTERVLVGSRATIGLHQAASYRPSDNSRHCSTSIDSNGMREIRSYVRWVMATQAEQIMDIIMRTPCTSIEWVSGQRALDLGIATRVEAEGVDVFGSKGARQ